MAEKRKRNGTDPQYEETTAPQNPPNSMLRTRARRGWLASSLGTLIAVFLIVASVFAWVFVRRELGKDAPVSPDQQQTIGTSGQRLHEKSPGGSDPAPDHNRTRDELKFRGVEVQKDQPATELTSKELKEQ
jgi:hypothetical protein